MQKRNKLKRSYRVKSYRILVTGASGSIGSELVRQMAAGNKIFMIDQNETGLFDLREELRAKGHWVHSRTGDIRDRSVLADVFEDFKPEYVFHAAALKHVTPGEEYPEEYVATNIIGTQNLIREAKRWECLKKFVYISTDKVVNASCIMGITKLCAEGLVSRAGEKFVAVRFGNVMHSRGSVLEIWKRQHEEGKPLSLTHPKMERFMMTIPEAVELVINAGLRGSGGAIWILDMGVPINIMELMKSLYPADRMTMIGMRPGEELTERLMTSDEEKRAKKVGKFYIIT